MEILLNLVQTSLVLTVVVLFYPTSLHWEGEDPQWLERLFASLVAFTVGLTTVYILARFIWS